MRYKKHCVLQGLLRISKYDAGKREKCKNAAMDFRKCGGVETVASIVSGGSVVKPGKKDGTNTLDQFMQWVLDGGDVEVEVGVVPARDSVRGARHEALGVARLACGVPELSKSILEIVPGAYGEAKKALHFLWQQVCAERCYR